MPTTERGRAPIVIAIVVALSAAIVLFVLPRIHSTDTKPASPPVAVTSPVTKAPPVAEPARTPEPAPAPEPRRRARAAAPVATTPASPAPAAEPAGGTIAIDADVPGASVFIDRVFVGTTPTTARGIAPGRHQLNASADGYEGISDPIDVGPGETTLVVRFKDVRIDAAIDVVHKHAMGSCRGRLGATPQAISYRTDNTGDAFSAPLTALDEFVVDYLKKNLRVKVKGRTYNFTDPANNADRLFVFHREVDKARQKLAAR